MARIWACRGATVLLLACLFTVFADAAAPAALGFGQFKHSRWTAEDGAPTEIRQIVQTPDGWLWLAAADGLYRFDGVTFERIAAPVGSAMERASPAALLVTRSGALWIGWAENGGVAVFHAGRLRAVPMPQPPRTVSGLAQGPDGAIWALWSSGYRDHRLHRWADGRWAEMDGRFGLPDGFPTDLCASADGRMWLSLSDQHGISWFGYLRPGEPRFVRVDTASCFNDRQGGLWISDKAGRRLIIGPNGRPPNRETAFPFIRSARPVALDGAGRLWGIAPTGIFFAHPIPPPARDAAPQYFSAAAGLTSDVVNAVFVDRERTVWIGSELGLDRFRAVGAMQEPAVPGDAGMGFAMARAGDRIYVGGSRGVVQVSPGQPHLVTDDPPGGICASQSGGLWAIYATRMRYFHHGEQKSVSLPRDAQLTGSCAVDRFQRLWISTLPGGLLWHDETGWHAPKHLAPPMLLPDVVATPAGDIAYTTATDLIRISGDRTIVTRLAPYNLNTITWVVSGTRDLFVVGINAVLRIRDGQVARLDARRFPWITRVRGIVQTALGETWLLEAPAMSRVRTADLDRAFDDPNAPLNRTMFDVRDGLRPAQQWSYRGIQIAEGSDGRIWLLDCCGASFIDPATLARNPLPPPVAIRSLASDGRTYRDPRQLILPAGTRSIEIAFAGLSLAVPERVQFRYRLDGVDDGWVDPGGRRLASYSNLGPGSYRFRVIAANNDGVWNRSGATLDFEIRPTFVQSWPFKLLCAALLLGVLWLAYALRLRALADRIRARMAERLEERERIARELHDTLLQSVQSLTLRFQLAVDDLPAGASGRAALEEAIDRADAVVAEGRDRVHDLRAAPARSDLEQIISDIVARQDFEPGTEFQIVKAGSPRMLDPLVLEEVTRIAGEAIFNIRRHAAARRVTIEIGFGANFSLCFVDDGVGIDIATANNGKNGHFGLSGMRERAAKLRGALAIYPVPDGGTRVMLVVPGHVAYKTERGWLGRFERAG